MSPSPAERHRITKSVGLELSRGSGFIIAAQPILEFFRTPQRFTGTIATVPRSDGLWDLVFHAAPDEAIET